MNVNIYLMINIKLLMKYATIRIYSPTIKKAEEPIDDEFYNQIKLFRDNEIRGKETFISKSTIAAL